MRSLLPLFCLLLWTSASKAADPCVNSPCNAWETCHALSTESHLCLSLTCHHTKYGEDYKGTLSTTYTGKTCQRWDSQSPHSHPTAPSDFVDETSLTDINNYCRNPAGGAGVWCYTTDVNARWEHCALSLCNDPCASNPCQGAETCHATSDTTYHCLSDHCYHVDRALHYMGTKAIAQDGQTCLRWDYYSYSRSAIGLLYMTGESLSEAANYCRNPDQGTTLWCYVDGGYQWCTIPKCDDTTFSTATPATVSAFRKIPDGVAVDLTVHPSSVQIVRSRIECAQKCQRDAQCVHFIMSEDGGKYLCETYISLNRPPTTTPPTDNYQRIIV